ncbi:hypothetical protein LDL77_15735 [Flagellimonas marinaquae]|uniref:hypothetical protein n=1 Tax=Flagellimonas aurea TaxID=2915619 RepID=UPI001CE180A7|nr:hypothetical protein LDL77_15735 [Allomuricauda aquimarina]
MTEKFKDLVNKSGSTLDDVKDNYKLLAERLKIDIKNYYSPRLIQDEIIKRFKANIDRSADTTNKSISMTQLKTVAQNLVYRYLLFDEPTLDYLNILQTLFAIKDARIKKVPPFEETDIWKKIISNVKDYKLVSNYSFDIEPERIREEYPQEYDRVIQLKILISEGCKVSIENESIEIKNIELAINKLDRIVKEIGGITLARSIFHLLSKNNYSAYFERYHLTRHGNGLGMHKSPQTPIGYLLNLCVKYPNETRTLIKIDKELRRIQDLSIAIVTSYYNVDHYNQWTHFFQTGETIIKFCTEIALWDSMYSLIQIRPKLSLQIIEELFKEINETTFSKEVGVSKAEYFSVLSEIFEIANDKNGVVTIYVSAIKKKFKEIDEQLIKRVLEINSHKAQANVEYLLPSDITKVDFQFNSLIKLSETKYILMDKSWCAPSLFESLATVFRAAKVKNFESNIGYALEKLIYKWLNDHGITYSRGTYSVNSIDGECDLLIEAKDAIILIEFKKKVLTRKAKSGIDIDLLIDLSDSILSSQIQAGRTEIILREKGVITLTDQKTNLNKTISWNGRAIERISLTQLDFGGFHDKTIINQFFNALLTHSYGTYSKEKRILKKFKELKAKQDKWSEQYNKLKDLDKAFNHFPYFDCSFMNLGQFLETINLSTDNDTFYEKLKTNKYVTFGTLDFYREFEMKLNMNKNAIHLQ